MNLRKFSNQMAGNNLHIVRPTAVFYDQFLTMFLKTENVLNLVFKDMPKNQIYYCFMNYQFLRAPMQSKETEKLF